MTPRTVPQSIPIVEIFSSLQGEGPYVGDKHIFVRVKNCNIHCSFCDELKTEYRDLTVDEVLNEIMVLEGSDGPHAAVSWTGGEPLLYPLFLRKAMAEARRRGYKNYLETSGILPKPLREVLEFSDVIAMDFKLPSVTGEKVFWKEHEEFLSLSKGKDVFVKMILSEKTDLGEFDEGVRIIRKVRPGTLLVLQPLSTEEHPVGSPENLAFLERLKARAEKDIESVRIILRLHKLLTIR